MQATSVCIDAITPTFNRLLQLGMPFQAGSHAWALVQSSSSESHPGRCNCFYTVLISGATMIALSITFLCTLLGGVCLYHFFFVNHGPLHISDERWEGANQSLKLSGDDVTKPLPLIAKILLVTLLFGDGLGTGWSIASGAFGAVLSPNLAMAAALVWSLLVTALLYKLIVSAAREGAINARRDSIRAMLTSTDADVKDQAAERMKLVGNTLGNTLDVDANRKSARVALVAAVLMLSISAFALRWFAEQASVEAQRAVPYSTQPTMVPGSPKANDRI
jgi:hypothetical protein